MYVCTNLKTTLSSLKHIAMSCRVPPAKTCLALIPGAFKVMFFAKRIFVDVVKLKILS